jgi:hypothetical protein
MATAQPPQTAPPSLQGVGDTERSNALARKQLPVCPEGQIPVPVAHSTRYFHKGNPLLGSYKAPGPAHALPNQFVNKNLLLPFDKVYGKDDGKPERPALPSVSDDTNTSCTGTFWYGCCYYYANAAERTVADGGGMTLEIELPVVVNNGSDGNHSIGEIAVEGPGSSLNDVEMGFNVSPDQYGDDKVHLFVYHWIDGNETCYDTCAWNQYSSIYYPTMDISAFVGQSVYLGWVHGQGAWWAWFNDQWLGYISDSEWSGNFTQTALIQWYGEVAESNGVPPLTQMGNGQFSGKATAATMATLCTAYATAWICSYNDQQNTSASDTTYYDVLNHTSFGALRYGGPGNTGIAPAVTVTPLANSVTTAQALSVTVAVSGGSGNPTPTGTVRLNSGSYASAAATLSSGSATINVPAGSLAIGADTLTAGYSPDVSSSSIYNSTSGSATVTVSAAKTTPTVTVAPSSSSIATAQVLAVTLAVSGGSGNPTPTGTVRLASGSYASAATTLSSGSATINVPAGSLAIGTDTLTASYSPDASSSSIYNSASGSASVAVVPNPVPAINSLAPPGVTAGGGAFLLSVNGSNFVNSSTVQWNGSARTTTYVSGTQLTAVVTETDIATVGSVPVTVFSSAPGGGTSGKLMFTVSNPPPRVLTLPPAATVCTGTCMVKGIVNPRGFAATYWFEYSTSEGFRQFSQTSHQSLPAGPKESAVSAALTGLVPDTVYHYRLAAQNSVGTSLGRILEFHSGGQKAKSSSTLTTLTDSAESQTLTGGGASVSSQLPTVRNTNTTNTRTAITVSTQAATLEVVHGQNTTLTVSLADFSAGAPITATCSGLPEGAACNYDDNSKTVTIAPSASTPPGSYHVGVVVTTAPETD